MCHDFGLFHPWELHFCSLVPVPNLRFCGLISTKSYWRTFSNRSMLPDNVLSISTIQYSIRLKCSDYKQMEFVAITIILIVSVTNSIGFGVWALTLVKMILVVDCIICCRWLLILWERSAGYQLTIRWLQSVRAAGRTNYGVCWFSRTDEFSKARIQVTISCKQSYLLGLSFWYIKVTLQHKSISRINIRWLQLCFKKRIVN